MDIDAVLLWVDGSDPSFASRLDAYVSPEQLKSEGCAAATRFSSLGELQRCIRSIRLFATFVKRIFVVTDGQDPGIDGVTIIDHREIYKGFESCLPVFSSRSIETMIFRIPGLSESYIYFNDDFILRRPCREEDFFRDGRLQCRASYRSIRTEQVLSSLTRHYGYKYSLARSALALGIRDRFLYTRHLPHPQYRSLFEEFYATRESVMSANCSQRFRSRGQYNPAALGYLLALQRDMCDVIPPDSSALYLKPCGRRGYVRKKIIEFEKHPEALSICVNSLDLAPEADRIRLFAWIDRMLDAYD